MYKKSNYKSDRAFTDYVYTKLAKPLIYDKLTWFPADMNRNVSNNEDLTNAIDRFLVDNMHRIITVQERFRSCEYKLNTDFTIRYKRDFNKHEERKLSEYFKLNCDYFLYGIINSSKFEKEKATNFIKYALIDIECLKKLINSEKIVIDKAITNKKCHTSNGVLHCPIIQNWDGSSSFVPFDIPLLIKLFPNNRVIVCQKGFIEEK